MHIPNGTDPHIQQPALLRRFRTWEDGFDLFWQGQPIEACESGHAGRTKAKQEGWRAGACVAKLWQDQEGIGMFCDVFHGGML